MRGSGLRVALAVAALLAIGGCAGAYTEAAYPPGIAPPADLDFFYSELAPYGHWFDTAGYGWVWSPDDLPVGWRPYSDGCWSYTDLGWAWVSYEPWGWATFHYGRWYFDDDLGWAWVPGYVWGPAWVDWRWSDEWVGWEPLPPDVDWVAGVGLRERQGERDRDADRHSWCFAPTRWLLDPRLSRRLAPSPRNITFLERTQPATRYDVVGGRPFDRGPAVADVERALGRSVPRFRVVDAPPSRRPGGGSVRGGAVAFFRPEVRPPAPGSVPASPGSVPTATSPRGTQPSPSPGPAGPSARGRRDDGRRQLQDFIVQEHRRMQAQQKEELRRSPEPSEQIRQRHEREEQAFQEMVARQQRILERRVAAGRPQPSGQAKKATR